MRGVAAVTGEPGRGIANIGGEFTDRKEIFGQAFNCTGGRPQARRVSTGVYEVRFPGNGARGAVVSGEAESTVKDVGGGVFRVSLWVAGRQDVVDAPFTLLLSRADRRSAAGGLHDVARLAKPRDDLVTVVALDLDGAVLDRATRAAVTLEVARDRREVAA